MAYRAIGEIFRVDVVGRAQPPARFGLVLRRRPGHVENRLARAQGGGGVAVAVEAPAHRERGGLAHQRHLVHAPVAGRAADAVRDVDAVVEIDVTRQVVDAPPAQGAVLGEACAHGGQHAGVGPDLGMARHAGLGRREAGEARLRDRGVAVAAFDSELPDMVLMAERHRLLARDVLLGHIGRAHDGVTEPDQQHRRDRKPDEQNACDGVRPRPEDLRHGSLVIRVWSETPRVRLRCGASGSTEGSRRQEAENAPGTCGSGPTTQAIPRPFRAPAHAGAEQCTVPDRARRWVLTGVAWRRAANLLRMLQRQVWEPWPFRVVVLRWGRAGRRARRPSMRVAAPIIASCLLAVSGGAAFAQYADPLRVL